MNDTGQPMYDSESREVYEFNLLNSMSPLYKSSTSDCKERTPGLESLLIVTGLPHPFKYVTRNLSQYASDILKSFHVMLYKVDDCS